MDRYQKVTMKKCPKCSSEHTYRLKVTRISVLHPIQPGVLGSEDAHEGDYEKVVRTFICPKTDEEFKAKFQLPHLADSEIQSIEVLGVV